MSDLEAANEGTSIGAHGASVLAYLDVVLVVLAAPVAIALGAPPLGYLIAAGAWVLQRVLQQLDNAGSPAGGPTPASASIWSMGSGASGCSPERSCSPPSSVDVATV